MKDELISDSQREFESIKSQSVYTDVDDDFEVNDAGETLSFWLPSTPIFVLDPFEIHLPTGEIRSYNLTLPQKLYLMLDDPRSW
jgi:hypothetical protein